MPTQTLASTLPSSPDPGPIGPGGSLLWSCHAPPTPAVASNLKGIVPTFPEYPTPALAPRLYFPAFQSPDPSPRILTLQPSSLPVMPSEKLYCWSTGSALSLKLPCQL